MAEMAGISKEYFSRIFRSVTGMNYSKWLNLIRLEKATELLADKEKTMTEVAMRSGFQSISSFNRVFHAEKGMPPGECGWNNSNLHIKRIMKQRRNSPCHSTY